MITILDQLTTIFEKAFTAAGHDASFGRVQVSDRPDLAPFQCNGALGAAKAAKKNPRAVAEEILVKVKDNPAFEKLEIAGPGFINVVPKDSFYIDALNQKSLVPQVKTPRTVFIDYGGANAAKPLHVGHLRTTVVGNMLKNLYRAMGDQVTGDVHWGDWGLPMGMVISEVMRRYPDLPYFQKNFNPSAPVDLPFDATALNEFYPVATARCKDNEADRSEASLITAELQKKHPGYFALWQALMKISRDDQEATYKSLGVTFEQWFGESRYQDRMDTLIKNLEKSGIVEESRGAKIIRVAKDDDKMEVPPLILTKTDGGYLYSTSDLATIEERVKDFKADCILYIVDIRQALHFEQVFRAARMGKILTDDVEVDFLGFGTINGVDGKPFKTREGKNPQLTDLVGMAKSKALSRMQETGMGKELSVAELDTIAEKIGQAALKFGELSNDVQGNYIFDLDKFTQFEGKTGPYLQYTAVRIKSLLAKAAADEAKPGALKNFSTIEEKNLALQLCLLPESLLAAYDKRAPHIVCEYAFVLAQSFSRFYAACHILSETDKAQQESWLKLSELTLTYLKVCLDILGIDIPERM